MRDVGAEAVRDLPDGLAVAGLDLAAVQGEFHGRRFGLDLAHCITPRADHTVGKARSACPPSLSQGGHAELVIGPARGRTRWLCPPYLITTVTSFRAASSARPESISAH